MTRAAKSIASSIVAHYGPENSGPWIAALDGDLALLVRIASPGREGALSADSLWSVIRAGDGVQSVLDALTANGLAATPHFALLSWANETVRVFVRGDATVRLHTDDSEKVLSGAGVSTWLEQTYTSAQRVTMTDGAETGIRDSDAPLPLVTGVVRTRAMSVSRLDASAESPRVVVTAPKALSAEHTISLTETIVPPHVQASSDSSGASALAGESVTQSPDEDGRENDEPDGFEQLFGATIVHGVQAAARSLESPPPEQEPVAESVVEAPKLPAPPTAPQPLAESQPSGAKGPAGSATPTRPSTTQIELPPFITGQHPAAAQNAPARAGDHDGETIMSDDLRALRRKAARAAGGRDASGAPVVNYQLRMPNGSVEALTTIVIIGRAPSVSKVSGGKLPRLLSLGNSDQDISRNHVQLELVGDTVVVTDLHSRNGTLVALPGQQPQRLRAGEPTAIVSGSVVDLGGGVAITLGVSE